MMGDDDEELTAEQERAALIEEAGLTFGDEAADELKVRLESEI